MKKLLYAAAALLYFSACAPDKFETVKIDNLYSLDVPSYMKVAHDLHADATLQYSNPLKEVYVIVIQENIDTVKQAFIDNDLTSEYSSDLNGYANLLMTAFADNTNDKSQAPLKDETINGMAAKTTESEGDVDGVKAYYQLAYVQGKQYYYQIVAWTIASSKDRYKNVLEKMIHSFKEL